MRGTASVCCLWCLPVLPAHRGALASATALGLCLEPARPQPPWSYLQRCLSTPSPPLYPSGARRQALANATARAELAVRRFYQPQGQEGQGAEQQQQQWEGEGELPPFYGALQVERIRGERLGVLGGMARRVEGWGLAGFRRAARGWGLGVVVGVGGGMVVGGVLAVLHGVGRQCGQGSQGRQGGRGFRGRMPPTWRHMCMYLKF